MRRGQAVNLAGQLILLPVLEPWRQSQQGTTVSGGDEWRHGGGDGEATSTGKLHMEMEVGMVSRCRPCIESQLTKTTMIFSPGKVWICYPVGWAFSGWVGPS